MMPPRQRLPNRRRCETTEIDMAGTRLLTATVGFARDGRPAELFLCGAKAGSEMEAILADASVVVSIALQCGLRASDLGRSVARLPETIDGPATAPASPIGAALDLLTRYERRAS